MLTSKLSHLDTLEGACSFGAVAGQTGLAVGAVIPAGSPRALRAGGLPLFRDEAIAARHCSNKQKHGKIQFSTRSCYIINLLKIDRSKCCALLKTLKVCLVFMGNDSPSGKEVGSQASL